MEIDICNSHDIKLSVIKREEQQPSFRIQFEVKNAHYNLYNAVGFKLFNLLGELNKDTIEQVYIEKYDESTTLIIAGIIFKQIGKDFGITQKYIFSKIKKTSTEDNVVRFVVNQADKPDSIQVPVGAESVINSSSILDIKLESPNQAIFNYYFSIDFEEDMPIHMENIPGLLMKKLFYRLKVFLDNII